MDSQQLASVRLKIDRGQEHRQTFEREVREFFGHEPDRAFADFDEDSQLRLKLTDPLPPHWGCILGDFFQNLRQALDHFVWAAALRTRARPSRNIAFPVTRDKDRWNDYLTTRPARETKNAVGRDAWNVICQLQPHARVQLTTEGDPDADPLWALNELARLDRHQALHLAIARQQGTRIGFGQLPRRGNVVAVEKLGYAVDETFPRFTTASVKDDPRMGGLSFTHEGVETKVSTYGETPFEIVFDPESTFAPNSWISPGLTAMYDTMKQFVLPAFESLVSWPA